MKKPKKFVVLMLTPYEEYIYKRMAKNRNINISEFLHKAISKGADYLFNDVDIETFGEYSLDECYFDMNDPDYES